VRETLVPRTAEVRGAARLSLVRAADSAATASGRRPNRRGR